jgi:hypothetical protein
MKKSNLLELIADVEYSGVEVKQCKLTERIGPMKTGHWEVVEP